MLFFVLEKRVLGWLHSFDMEHPIIAVTGLFFCYSMYAQSLTPLPFGNNGIASHYSLDSGIGKDTSFILFDDFESYKSASELNSKWDGGVYQNVSFSTDGEVLFAGKQSLEFRCPKQEKALQFQPMKTQVQSLAVLFLSSRIFYFLFL